MPFLRRRGVMASESDMRRHTTLIDPKAHDETFLTPQSTAASRPPGNNANANDNNDNEDHDRDASTDSQSARDSRDPYDRPDSPPVQDETPKHRRFSMLRFRNASDSQLSARWRQQEKPPPMPEPPTIITTAPTSNISTSASAKKPSGVRNPLRIRRSIDVPASHQEPQARLRVSSGAKKDKRKAMPPRADSSASKQTVVTFEEPSRGNSLASQPPNADDHASASANSVARMSESSRSENSSIEHALPIHHSSSSLFRFGRRRHKTPEPLFPVAHLAPRSKTPALSAASSNAPSLARQSTSSRPSTGHDRALAPGSPGPGAAKTSGSPATALFRPSSRNSGQASPTRMHLSLRGRSSTMSSTGESFLDPHSTGTTRTSISTGRKSFGDLLGLGRARQNTDPGKQGSLTPATPGSNTSKDNSLQLTRESVVLPERKDDESPAKYLSRIEGMLPRGTIAAALSKETDVFFTSVLRSYMRSFSFFEEPMDMAIRKLLMEAELPKETQQIDRCLQAFANRYHECNPGIYATPDQAYFIAFSLLILHTDVYNKNNKHKMQKSAYLKNTAGEGIFDDVLGCFYDNISYTPFIHVEDDLASHTNGERAGSIRSRQRFAIPKGSTQSLRRHQDPIDPYTLIIDGKLDVLRSPLKDQIPLEEHYSYLGTANRLNLKELQKTFFRTGVLQIVSARSRPDAFMTEKTQHNPEAAEPGIVDIKVTKVGLLWRKGTKRQRGRSPWQEWGAILTGAQLYFFRNTAWVKNLVHQYETHIKLGHDGVPLIFKPPLDQFKPDGLMSTDGAVALWDTNYRKHKNAFVYVRHGGLEEVLLAQSEEDRNDWLAKLNYAAAFRTSGVRMRGVVGGNYEGQSRRAIRRLDSNAATQLIQTPSGDVTINRGKIDHQMARDILLARRGIMGEKIEEAEDKLQAAQKHLDTQLRNARHLLILAPIQERTREEVRLGAAKIIAQLRWSRNELWRLKCHRDVLALDLAEEKEMNGDILDGSGEPSTPATDPKEARTGTPLPDPRSPSTLSPPPSSESQQPSHPESPASEVFRTPPTSATVPSFGDLSPPPADQNGDRKTSISSIASSVPEGDPVSSCAHTSTSPTRPELGGEDSGDGHERRVLEQAGLLEMESARTADRRPSSAYTNDEGPDRGKRGSVTGQEKDKSDKSDKGKVRRSLQRTLRDGAGHLSHHRSNRRGKESASSGGAVSDENARDEVLDRGTGSFTVHGKKASVINFGNGLHGISTDQQLMRHRKNGQGDDSGTLSPTSGDDDFVSVMGDTSERRDRRGSGTSASTATARSFRELHRKYSSSRPPKTGSNLVVPSDEDSDAAISFSDGRRSPLPPLDDEDEDGGAALGTPMQAEFYTPDPPASPTNASDAEGDEKEDENEGGLEDEAKPMTHSAVQEVHA
ncbi:hypothetical protein F5Y18DRAFT_365546 [Xylariaceae sp. FL1019]|nr:hypothetical protein F5Y18DRAFT_365546 [Xylariaceae sp. FL1019]